MSAVPALLHSSSTAFIVTCDSSVYSCMEVNCTSMYIVKFHWMFPTLVFVVVDCLRWCVSFQVSVNIPKHANLEVFYH